MQDAYLLPIKLFIYIFMPLMTLIP